MVSLQKYNEVQPIKNTGFTEILTFLITLGYNKFTIKERSLDQQDKIKNQLVSQHSFQIKERKKGNNNFRNFQLIPQSLIRI